MTSTTIEQGMRRSDGEFPSGILSSRPVSRGAQASLAETQEAILKDLVTAQLTTLDAFERLVASTRPASEDLMNQFTRELMLGLFRLYPIGQEISRQMLNAMTQVTQEYSNALRSALQGVDGQGALRSRAARDGREGDVR